MIYPMLLLSVMSLLTIYLVSLFQFGGPVAAVQELAELATLGVFAGTAVLLAAALFA